MAPIGWRSRSVSSSNKPGSNSLGDGAAGRAREAAPAAETPAPAPTDADGTPLPPVPVLAGARSCLPQEHLTTFPAAWSGTFSTVLQAGHLIFIATSSTKSVRRLEIAMVVDRLEPGVGRHRIVVLSGSHLWREWLARGGSLGCGNGASRATDCIRRRKALASAKSGGGKIEPFNFGRFRRICG